MLRRLLLKKKTEEAPWIKSDRIKDGRVCYSFQQAVEFLRTAADYDSPAYVLHLDELTKLKKEDSAALIFTDLLLTSTNLRDLQFSYSTIDSIFFEKISRALSDSAGLSTIRFHSIYAPSSKVRERIKHSFSKRKPDVNFKLGLYYSDEKLFNIFVDVSAVIGGSLCIKHTYLNFVNTSKNLARWSFTSPMVKSIELTEVFGLSRQSHLVLAKGLRYFSGLSSLTLDATSTSSGALLLLTESLRTNFSQRKGILFALDVKDATFNQASFLKFTELYVDFRCLTSFNFTSFNSTIEQRLIATRVIANGVVDDISLMNTSFLESKDFELLHFALKTTLSIIVMCFTKNSFTSLQRRTIRDFADRSYIILTFLEKEYHM